MPTTALIAAGVGAAGSVGSALIGSSASKNASNQQVAMQQQALQQQKDLFNQGLTTASNAENPFINAGQSVLGTLKSLITPGADQSATLSQTPGFQFASQYGTKAATNALSARSGASAGPLATAISQYNNGLAQNTWQNTVNALSGYANMGASAAGQFGNSVLGGSITAGNSQAGTLGNIGNAQAAGTLGSANALASGVTGVAGAGTNALLYSQLFGQNGSGGDLYSGNALANGPSNSAISNASDDQIAQYESMFG